MKLSLRDLLPWLFGRRGYLLRSRPMRSMAEITAELDRQEALYKFDGWWERLPKIDLSAEERERAARVAKIVMSTPLKRDPAESLYIDPHTGIVLSLPEAKEPDRRG